VATVNGLGWCTMADRPLTPAMRRELQSIATCGRPSDPLEWHGAGALWFHARDRVLGALLRRELIRDESGDYVLTEAGRAAAGVAGAFICRKPAIGPACETQCDRCAADGVGEVGRG
jgi:hypothetical protein